MVRTAMPARSTHRATLQTPQLSAYLSVHMRQIGYHVQFRGCISFCLVQP
jgi:hypothetical protein